MDGLSNSDVALLQRDGGFGGSDAFFWIFALLIFAGGGFNGFGNGNRGDYVSQADLANQLNAQTQTQQLQQIALSSANNNYETAQLINAQTLMMTQNFNALGAGLANIAQSISQLGYHMDQCCCEIKTQMLQDRLQDAQTALLTANENISNANQSQYILSQLGRFVAYSPSGTAPASANG